MKQPSRHDCIKALQHFTRNGGLVQRYPAQATPRRKSFPAHLSPFESLESLAEFASVASAPALLSDGDSLALSMANLGM